MNKTLRGVVFLVAVLLCGFIGFAMATDMMPDVEPVEPAAMQLDVNLADSKSDAQINAGIKTHETEPEERPSPGDIEVEIVSHTREEGVPMRVLIYHTHTYEAYEPTDENPYKPTERWRTADAEHNIVRVGAEIARILREDYGMVVVHDDTAFEPPRLDTAYQRSLEAIENYTARGETFDLYLDIHRDAFSEGLFDRNQVMVNGETVARAMMLIGKGTGTYKGQAFAQMPKWEENLARAECITEAVNTMAEGVCRKVSTKSSRYNQHVSTGALLIEIGNNMNTLEEALRTAAIVAHAIGETSGGQNSVATE